MSFKNTEVLVQKIGAVDKVAQQSLRLVETLAQRNPGLFGTSAAGEIEGADAFKQELSAVQEEARSAVAGILGGRREKKKQGGSNTAITDEKKIGNEQSTIPSATGHGA